MDDETSFYEKHRGGYGAVVMVRALHDDTQDELVGIFGSIETAKDWRRSLSEKFSCLFSPYIIDDPDWGNRTQRN